MPNGIISLAADSLMASSLSSASPRESVSGPKVFHRHMSYNECRSRLL